MSRSVPPVALIVFNRPDTTRRVFDAIAAARPEKLFLIADGPRADRPGEAERCAEVRKIISNVNWPCDVQTDFSQKNLGCRRRVVSGLDWVFTQVEETMILEDDCLPDQTFFRFCSELLDRYRNCEAVGAISGFNPARARPPATGSYYFSKAFTAWGWATWRRTWKKYDEQIKDWPEIKKNGLLKKIWSSNRAIEYWTLVFDSSYNNPLLSTWDYQFVYAGWTKQWLNIFSNQNLVQNIGFREDATHTSKVVPGLEIAAESMCFPLKHPDRVSEWPPHALEIQNRFFSPRVLRRLGRKLLSVIAP